MAHVSICLSAVKVTFCLPGLSAMPSKCFGRGKVVFPATAHPLGNLGVSRIVMRDSSYPSYCERIRPFLWQIPSWVC